MNKFQDSIKIVDCNKYDIPYVSKKEQKLIEKELKNKDCFKHSSKEKIEINI